MIKLTKFENSDISQLISWIPDARFALQWAGPKYEFHNLKENIQSALCESQKPNPTIFLFNAYCSDCNKTVGHIQLLQINVEKKEGRIGKVLICDKYRGNGYGIKMVEELCKFSFNHVLLDRLTLAVYDFNTIAIKAYEKIGFKKLHFIKNATIYAGENWNSFEMELSKAKTI